MKLRLRLGERESYTGVFAATTEAYPRAELVELREAHIEVSREQAEELAHWLNKMLFGVRVLTTEAN